MLCPVCLTPVPRFVPDKDNTGANILRCPKEGCENSSIPLRYARDYASHPAIACSMIGLPGHGKTRYIDGFLKALGLAGRHWPDFTYQWLDDRTAAMVKQRRLDYEAGIPPEASSSLFPEPVICRLSGVPRVGGCQLVFFDVSGEVFLNPEVLRDAGRYVHNSPAVIWLSSLLQPTDDGKGLMEVDPESLSDMLTVYQQGMESMGGDTRNQRVIFTITKADLYLEDPDFPDLAKQALRDDVFKAGAGIWESIDTLSAELEKWLRKKDFHNVINVLKTNFREVCYTVVSAQGADTQLQPGTKLEPKGVFLPLFWLWRTQRPSVWIEHQGRREYVSSLQSAIESAPPGATIALDPGVHFIPKSLTFRQPVTLRGTDRESTIIEGAAGPFLAGVSLPEGVFAASGVTFRHRGPEASDLIRVAAGQVEFDGCVFRGGRASKDRKVPGSALRLDGDAAATVRNCLFTKNEGSGLVAACSRPVIVKNSQFLQNVSSGIAVGGGEVRAADCVFRVNAYGIRAYNQAAVMADGCEFHECVHGISVSDTASARVGGASLFQANHKSGMRLEKSASAVCEGGRFVGGLEHGVLVGGSASLTAAGNLFARNKTGARVEETGHLDLRDNKFQDRNGDAAVFADESRAECQGNEFYRSTGFGIRVEGTARPAMSGNTFDSNTGGDVYLAATVHRSVVPDKPPKGQPPYRVTDKRR